MDAKTDSQIWAGMSSAKLETSADEYETKVAAGFIPDEDIAASLLSIAGRIRVELARRAAA